MPATAPTAAPEETPVTPGSANGLRKTACMTTPTPASAPPTSIATTIRGSRMDQTTVLTWLGSGDTTAAIASSGSRRRVPRLTLTSIATTSARLAPAASHRARRGRRGRAGRAGGAAGDVVVRGRDGVSSWGIGLLVRAVAGGKPDTSTSSDQVFIRSSDQGII